MIDDEPAFWATIPDHQRDRVMIAARAMCNRHLDDPCACDRWGGTCGAFFLFGDQAFAAIKALDRALLAPAASGEGA